MLELLIDKMHDPKMMASVFAAIAAMATVITLAMPLLARNDLNKRMNAVSVEREKIRQRERERLARGDKVQLRQTPKQYMKRVVDQFNLTKWVGQEEAREKLIQAGYRGQAPYVTYLFFRMVSPVVAFAASLFYIFVVLQMDKDAWHRNSLDHRERVTTLSDEEFKTIYEYLSTNFGPHRPVPKLPKELLKTWTGY